MDLDQQKARVQAALRQLLRPVVRLLLRSGCTWREFAELAKTTFVEVAQEDFGKRGRPTNASRIAILTGLSRREVALQRVHLEREEPPSAHYMSRASRVLSGWHQDPEFLGEDGLPAVLSFEGSIGSFEALSRRYAGDVPIVAMFKELSAAGAVRREPADDSVSVLRRAYVPTALNEDQLRLWGSVLHDVGATLTHNLTRSADERPRFERRAVSLSVDARDLPAFRAFLEREGQAFLERVDDWLTNHEVKDEVAARRKVRLGAGLYQIEGPKTKD